MRTIVFFVVTLCAPLSALAGPWSAQRSALNAPTYVWVREYPGWDYLYENGRLKECRSDQGDCYELVDGEWVESGEHRAASQEPSAPRSALDARRSTHHFGMDWKPNGHEAHNLNGRPVSRQAAEAAIVGTGVGVPDDAGKLRLTVIGSEAERRPVFAELAQQPQDWRERLLTWAVDPTHWSVAQAGYVTSGHPTVYLQDAAGKVLWRQAGFQAGDFQKIRKADPNYKPENDPGPWSGFSLAGVPPAAWVLAALGLGFVVLLWRR